MTGGIMLGNHDDDGDGDDDDDDDDNGNTTFRLPGRDSTISLT